MTTPFTRALVTPDGERSFLIFGYPQAPKISLNREKLDSVKFLALDLYGGPERLEVARLAYRSGVQTAINDVVLAGSSGIEIHQYRHQLGTLYPSKLPRRGRSGACPPITVHLAGL